MFGTSAVSGAVVTLVTANKEGECESNRSLKEVNEETANCCQEPVGSEPLSRLTTKQRWVKATCRLQDAGHKSVFFGDQAFVYFTGNLTVLFMCFVWISEQTAIISLYSIN